MPVSGTKGYLTSQLTSQKGINCVYSIGYRLLSPHLGLHIVATSILLKNTLHKICGHKKYIKKIKIDELATDQFILGEASPGLLCREYYISRIPRRRGGGPKKAQCLDPFHTGQQGICPLLPTEQADGWSMFAPLMAEWTQPTFLYGRSYVKQPPVCLLSTTIQSARWMDGKWIPIRLFSANRIGCRQV